MTSTEIRREIEGGTATFAAGCSLSSFSVSPSIKVSNLLSIKTDTNAILVRWQPSKEITTSSINNSLAFFGGPLQFCQRAPKKLQGHSEKATIASFHQPEHAQAALKHFNSTPGTEAKLVYTLHFTSSTGLADAMFPYVQSTLASYPRIRIAILEPGDGMLTMRFSGTDQDKVHELKRDIERVYAGRIATTGETKHYEIWHDSFGTPQGEVWLRNLERETGVVVRSDKSQQRVRIYDWNLNGVPNKERVEQELEEKIAELKSFAQTYSISLDTRRFQELIASNSVMKAREHLGAANVNLDIVNKSLVLRCGHERARLIAEELFLPDPLPSTPIDPISTKCSNCGDNALDIHFTCGHSVCKDCFDHQIEVASTDLTSNNFPLVCWHENCEKPISIPDLRKYIPSKVWDTLLQASLTYHIRSLPDMYHNCRKLDCKSVYLRDGSYEIFTCPRCLTLTCTLCNAKPHAGQTCDEYRASFTEEEWNEGLMDEYKAAAGTKECPRCATLIEKVDGCNHVECGGCHGHICWICLMVFGDSDSAYLHMNAVHGGIGVQILEELEGLELDDVEEEVDGEHEQDNVEVEEEEQEEEEEEEEEDEAAAEEDNETDAEVRWATGWW